MTLTRSLDKRGGFISVFLWQLRRTLPAAIVYWIMMALLTLWDWFIGHGYNDYVRPIELLIIGFAVALPMVHLSDCFSRRQADFIHALPVTRGSFYLSALLNALWQILLPIIPCRLFTVYVTNWRVIGASSYHIRSLALAAIAILCFMFLAAAASGTYHGYVIGAAAHLAGWRMIVLFMYFVISGTIPGAFNYSGPDMDLFFVMGSPVLLQFMNFDSHVQEVMAYIIMPIFSAICAALGYVLYKRRKSEQAGHFGKCRPAELFLRIELTLCAGLFALSIIPIIVRDTWISAVISGALGIPLTLGGTLAALALAYIILEYVWHRSIKNLRRHALPVLISTGIIVVFTGAVSTGLGLEENIPDVSEIGYVGFTEMYPSEQFSMNECWAAKLPGMGEDEVTTLDVGVYSLEMVDKVQELNAKYLELERAAQYPYLPGRNTYDNQIYITLHYNFNGLGYQHNTLKYDGPVNSKTQPLLDEFMALRDEIMTSDEYVNSLNPLNAIDAVVSLDVLDGEDRSWGVVTRENMRCDPKPVEDLPRSFIKDLEAAMREDFKNNCYPTVDEVAKAKYPVYQLAYDGEFTARGGTYWDDKQNKYIPAEGVEFELYLYNDEPRHAFRVTKEMPAAYELLAKAYK